MKLSWSTYNENCMDFKTVGQVYITPANITFGVMPGEPLDGAKLTGKCITNQP
jgi:hypothetical protein